MYIVYIIMLETTWTDAVVNSSCCSALTLSLPHPCWGCHVIQMWVGWPSSMLLVTWPASTTWTWLIVDSLQVAATIISVTWPLSTLLMMWPASTTWTWPIVDSLQVAATIIVGDMAHQQRCGWCVAIVIVMGMGCTSQSPRQSMGLHKDSRIPWINSWTPWTSYKYTNFRKGKKRSPWIIYGIHGLIETLVQNTNI